MTKCQITAIINLVDMLDNTPLGHKLLEFEKDLYKSACLFLAKVYNGNVYLDTDEEELSSTDPITATIIMCHNFVTIQQEHVLFEYEMALHYSACKYLIRYLDGLEVKNGLQGGSEGENFQTT